MGKLKNIRREAFCLAYAGPAWGCAAEAYRSAGYRAKNAQVAASAGERLLRSVDISERIAELRDDVERALQVDRLEVAKHRLDIIRSTYMEPAVRLAAMRDFEKAMGWLVDESKVKVEHSGEVAVEHRWTVSDLLADERAPGADPAAVPAAAGAP